MAAVIFRLVAFGVRAACFLNGKNMFPFALFVLSLLNMTCIQFDSFIFARILVRIQHRRMPRAGGLDLLGLLSSCTPGRAPGALIARSELQSCDVGDVTRVGGTACGSGKTMEQTTKSSAWQL